MNISNLKDIEITSLYFSSNGYILFIGLSTGELKVVLDLPSRLNVNQYNIDANMSLMGMF
jgi:hypothetical protein